MMRAGRPSPQRHQGSIPKKGKSPFLSPDVFAPKWPILYEIAPEKLRIGSRVQLPILAWHLMPQTCTHQLLGLHGSKEADPSSFNLLDGFVGRLGLDEASCKKSRVSI